MKNIPIQIKAAVIALILSGASSLVGRYFREIEGSGFGYSDTWSVGFSIVWLAIVIWLIWDLINKKKDIRVVLAFVSVIMFAGTALGWLDSKLTLALLFETLELAAWLIAFVFLNASQSKEWYTQVRR